MASNFDPFTFTGRLISTDAAGGQGTGVSLTGVSFEVDVANLPAQLVAEGQFHVAGWFEHRDCPDRPRVLTFVAKDPTTGLKVEKEFDGILKRITDKDENTTGWELRHVSFEVDLSGVADPPQPMRQEIAVTGLFDPRTFMGRRVSWTLVATAAGDPSRQSAPATPSNELTIAAIAADPAAFVGRTLELDVRYFGWSQPPEVPIYGDVNGKSDWAIADATGWCNIHGEAPFKLDDPQHLGQAIRIEVFVQPLENSFLLWAQPKIADIAEHPLDFVDVSVPLRGEFWGYGVPHLLPFRFFGEPTKRSDWTFADPSGSCPVCGIPPYPPQQPEFRGRQIEMVAVVVMHNNTFCLQTTEARPIKP